MSNRTKPIQIARTSPLKVRSFLKQISAHRSLRRRISFTLRSSRRIIFRNQDVNSILAYRARKDVYFKPNQYELRLDPNVPLIEGVITEPDPECLWQMDPITGWAQTLGTVIFSLLLHNSLKAGATKIEIHNFIKDGNVIIDIADNGCGIPRQYEEKLFGKGATFSHEYFRGKDGLGLYYSKKLLKTIGGEITLIRNVPKSETSDKETPGVTFRITLPTSRPEAAN